MFQSKSDEVDALRARLERMLAKTASAKSLRVGGFWVGDRAGERAVYDDFSTGRLFWRAARDHAECGIQALNGGDLESAHLHSQVATDLYIDALEAHIRPSDLSLLGRSAKRRGRPQVKLKR
jgi:hypothetical protein